MWKKCIITESQRAGWQTTDDKTICQNDILCQLNCFHPLESYVMRLAEQHPHQRMFWEGLLGRELDSKLHRTNHTNVCLQKYELN